MERKVVKTGKSSLIITLPHGWVKKTHITPGATITIEESALGELILRPKEISDKSNKLKKAFVDITKVKTNIEKLILAEYLKGADIITIVSAKPISSSAVKSINQLVAELVGTEIIEVSNRKIVIQDLTGNQKIPIKSFLRRLDLMARNQLDSICTVLQTGDKTHLETMAEASGIEKTYRLLIKKLIQGLKDFEVASQLKISPGDAVSYTIIVRNIKAIVTYLEQYIQLIMGSDILHSKMLKEITDVTMEVNKLYLETSETLFKRNIKQTLDVMTKCSAIIGRIYKIDKEIDYLPPKDQQPLEDGLYFLKTVVENTRANAELILTIEEPNSMTKLKR
jgi:phosphate uptake regulator